MLNKKSLLGLGGLLTGILTACGGGGGGGGVVADANAQVVDNSALTPVDPMTVQALVDDGEIPVIGLSADGLSLVSFTTFNPSPTTSLGLINGLMNGDTQIIGIDVRPQDGLLYGVGDNGGLYVFNNATSPVPDAVATFIKQISVADANGNIIPVTFPGNVGIDFSPPANALRIITDQGLNYAALIDPNAIDVQATSITLGGNLVTGVTGIAYINNDNVLNVTGSVLYDINPSMGPDIAYVQAPANAGTLTTTAQLTDAAGNLIDLPANDVGFDIYSRLDLINTVTPGANAAISNTGYTVFTDANQLTSFNLFDLNTSRVTFINTLDVPVRDIALPLQVVITTP